MTQVGDRRRNGERIVRVVCCGFGSWRAHSRQMVAAGVVVIAACFGVAPQRAVAQTESVRVHCARVGEDDRTRPLRSKLVADARRLFEIDLDLSSAFVATSTFTRCMNGKVWLCYVGANLACGKADVSDSAGAAAFCRQNPNSASVPMSATGHATVYSWKCVGTKATIDQQFERVDPRGFVAENWKELR